MERREQPDSAAEQSQSTASAATPTTRFSARVRAAQNRDQTSQSQSATTSEPSTSTQHPNTRASARNRTVSTSTGKGPAPRTRRPNASISTGIVINEPTPDRKGKKRAAPEPDSSSSEDEQQPSSSSKQPPTKRARFTRSSNINNQTASSSTKSPSKSTISTNMPRKSRSSTSSAAVAKTRKVGTSKQALNTSSSVNHSGESDVDMMDPEPYSDDEQPAHPDPTDNDDIEATEKQRLDAELPGPSAMDSDAPSSNASAPSQPPIPESSTAAPTSGTSPPPVPTSAASLLSALSAGVDDSSHAAALSMLGADFRSLGAHMMAHTTKLKGYLEAIKPTSDPLVRFSALQELNELLVMSNEDTLSGYFQVDAFTRELIGILGGKRTGGDEDDDEDHDDDHDEDDEDGALAAALAMSGGGGGFEGDENPEAQVLASRCLYNMMEALPGTAHTVVFHGAIPALCSKLLEIQFIDLAEQNISTLDKISEECASSVARQGGLPALLNFLDFFNTSVQRTAMHAAANCCRNASSEVFKTVKEVLPIIQNVLSYPDQRLVESAALCVIRLIESYHRQPDLLDELLTLNNKGLLRAINNLLLPAGGSPLISAGTYTLFLRALSSAARSSIKTAVALLEADISSTIYQILTGVLPPADPTASTEGDQGVGGSVADMAVMQSLAHRPKDQVEEALSLIAELMPPLAKDGVFDHRAYSEKALAKMVKHKAKAERAAAKQAKTGVEAITTDPLALSTPALEAPLESENGGLDGILPGIITRGTSPVGSDGPLLPEPKSSVSSASVLAAAARTELLRGQAGLLMRFMRLMTPVLVEVYAASVAVNIRTRALTGMLKAASFLESDELWKVVEHVPLASFIGSILSSRDHQTLLAGALQLVELLLMKLPVEYKSAFRREGVLHEVITISDQDLSTKVKTEPTSTSNTPAPDDGSGSASLPPPMPSGGLLRRSGHYGVDSQDANILRARVVRFKYLSAGASEDGNETDNDELEALRSAAKRLSSSDLDLKSAKDALRIITDLFGRQDAALSSFEMLKSGLVEELLAFASDETRHIPLKVRQRLIVDMLTSRPASTNSSPANSPLGMLVKRLQESLTRMESFEVVTVSPSGDDSRRNSASLLARQLRLRLVGEGSDIPKNCTNITVSIHAIATFQALHDYLRPRVASQGVPANSRISGMLAAFAAAAGLPPGALQRATSSADGQSVGGSNSAQEGRSTKSGVSTTAPSTGAAAQQSNATASGSESESDKGPRRSRRLSAKSGVRPPPASSSPVVPTPAATTTPSASTAASGSLPQPKIEPLEPMDMDDSYMDDELDPEILEDEHNDSPKDEKAVNLSVVEDGNKVVAQTPDGTRVATPTPASTRAAGSADSSNNARSSYASALKTKPTDWHLEFSIEGHPIPLETTIYGAIHQHEARKSTKPSLYLSAIWSSVYTIKFKKVPGPSPLPESPVDATVSVAPAVPSDSPHAQILSLLRVLHKINAESLESLSMRDRTSALPETSFINNKLTAKLTRQLEEPMIVASACLPDWGVDLPQHYPFLFPFATRFLFLQSTSFGYARLILKWQNQQNRSSDGGSRRDDTFGYLGRLQRQKVRVSRTHLLQSAIRVLELYGSSSSVLEVEYYEEVGTGLGPTLEFYSLVSKEFARRDIKIWHDADAMMPGLYVHHPTGLFPAPFSPSDVAKEQEASGKKRSDLFRVLGQFVAKALLDSRIIDLAFNRTFLKLIMGQEISRSIDTLMDVDPTLASSLRRVQQYAAAQAEIKADMTMTAKARESALESIMINDATLQDLSLDFTLPGYGIELIPGGADISVDHRNVHQYIDRVLDVMLEEGVRIPVTAFREGFSRVFPIWDLQTFSIDEIVTIFGSPNEDWSLETLSDSIKADHGFNTDSRAFRDLVQVLSSYDSTSRREFLQFITGSPKLPIGGFRGLSPPLTVVRKPHEAPLSPDDYLPSVMTCVNYLKLPAYSSRDVLSAKLAIATKEGGGSFHLS